MLITWIGHAGFIVSAGDKRILIDPWFNPAFLGAWRPNPDNSVLADWVAGQRYDYLYISHGHEDHFDRAFLARLPCDCDVICADWMDATMSQAGFRARSRLPGGWRVIQDDYRQDSGLLIEADGQRALFANDMNLADNWPTDVDVLACQFSGASWYPHQYDYEPAKMARKVEECRKAQLDMLVSKIERTNAKRYIPCAGPARVDGVAIGPGTAFPLWEEIEGAFRDRCPDVRVAVPRLAAPPAVKRRHGYTTFVGPQCVFDKIDAGECSWEEALLSMKLRLSREVDRYDPALDVLRGRAC